MSSGAKKEIKLMMENFIKITQRSDGSCHGGHKKWSKFEGKLNNFSSSGALKMAKKVKSFYKEEN